MVFYFNIFKDEIYCARLIHQIKKFYPDATIIAIADGPCHNVDFFESETIFIQGERLKVKDRAMQFTQRNFTTVLENTDAEKIIKLDPDSYIWSSLLDPPDVDWAGSIRDRMVWLGKIKYCHGACWIMKRSAMQTILDSEYLLDTQYNNHWNLYERYTSKAKYGDAIDIEETIPHEDFILGDVVRRLELSVGEWEGLKLQQMGEVIEEGYSVTHPVRHIW